MLAWCRDPHRHPDDRPVDRRRPRRCRRRPAGRLLRGVGRHHRRRRPDGDRVGARLGRGPGRRVLRPRPAAGAEATIHPEPGSWSGVHAPTGYDVVLLSDAGDAADAPTRTLLDAVESWAADEDVTVTPVSAKDADDRIAAVLRAVDAGSRPGHHRRQPHGRPARGRLADRAPPAVPGRRCRDRRADVERHGGGLDGRRVPRRRPRPVEPLRPRDLHRGPRGPWSARRGSPPCSTTCAASSSGCPDPGGPPLRGLRLQHARSHLRRRAECDGVGPERRLREPDRRPADRRFRGDRRRDGRFEQVP